MKKKFYSAMTALSVCLLATAAEIVLEVDAAQAKQTEAAEKRTVLKFSSDPKFLLTRSAALPMDESFSFYAWVKPEARPEKDVAAMIGRPGRHVKLSYTARGTFRFSVWSDDNRKFYVESKEAAEERKWTQVAGVYDREKNTLFLFLNGDPAGTARAPRAMFPNQAPFWFGSAAPPDNPYPFLFKGSADRMRVYRGALSAGQVAELFRKEAPDYGVKPDTGRELPEEFRFDDNKTFSVNRNAVDISEDGKTIRVKEGEPFSHRFLFHTRPGILKQNTIYTVTFTYRLDSDVPEEAFFNFYSRSHTSPGVHPLLKFDTSSRKEETRTVQLITKDEADHYIFSVDAYHSARGEISDFSIRESRIADHYIAVEKDAPPYSGTFPPLPTGCPEFDVRLPDGDGAVVNAADFGFSASAEDNTKAFQAALEYCRDNKVAKLVFSKGEYRLSGAVQIRGLKNLEIDGGGSLFLYSRDLKNAKENIVIRDSSRVRIRNLNFDWDWEKMPLGSLVEVVNVNGDEIDFRFCDYEQFPVRDIRVAMVSEMDPEKRLVTVENKAVFHFEFYLGHYAPETAWLSGNVLRVKDRGNNWNKEHLYYFKKGQFFRMLHAYYEGGMFLVEDCSDFSFEDIDIYSTPGKNFHFRGMKNWQLLRVRCAPPEGRPERVVSSTADGYGHERCFGNLKMEECFFSGGNDDFINIQDNSIYVGRLSENSLVTINLKGPLPQAGDKLELRGADYTPLQYTAEVKATREIGAEHISEGLPWGDRTKKQYEIVLDRPLPEHSEQTFVAFNLRFNSGNAIFRRCRFENTEGSGRFQAANITIEDCVFKNNANASLRVATGYTLRAWNEGYGVDNLVVRNCTFDMASGGVRNIAGVESDCEFHVYTPDTPHGTVPAPVFRNILIEDNTFRNSCGLIASITSASSVIVRNNRFINTLERKRKMSYRGAILVTHSENIYIVNNRYLESEPVLFPGVFFDGDNVKNLVVKGNAK